jgi:hypothetical protein
MRQLKFQLWHMVGKNTVQRLKMVVSTHQRQKPLLLACRISTQESTGTTPANKLFGKEGHMYVSWSLVYGAYTDKEDIHVHVYVYSYKGKVVSVHEFSITP